MSRYPPIGIDSFAYHRWFGECSPWESGRSERWKTTDFLDRAQDLGVDGVSVQTVYLDEVSPASMRHLEVAARDRGLDVVLAWGHRSGLEGGANPARFLEAMRCIEAAAYLGTALVRIVCGDQESWRVPVADRITLLVPQMAALSARAEQLGIAIAIENHADFAMADLVALIELVGADNLGICLDLGNAIRVGDDVTAAAVLASPHVRMVHAKDVVVQQASLGDPAAWWPTAPLGRGDLPVAEALAATLASPHAFGWYVEMANMHPDHPDEDTAVAESIEFLRRLAG